MASYIIVTIIAYLLGSISFSVIISKKMAGFDVREKGSGNAGTTNVLRNVGKKASIITLVCDILKGVVAILVSYVAGLIMKDSVDKALLIQLAGIAVILGHTFPIFFGFKGGKGIAVLAGLVVATHPVLVPIPLTCFLIASILTRYVSLGSLLAATTFFMEIILYGEMGGLGMSLNYRIETYVLACVIMVLAWFRHKENIKRLIAGTENRFGSKK